MDMNPREIDLGVEREHDRRLARYEAEMDRRDREAEADDYVPDDEWVVP